MNNEQSEMQFYFWLGEDGELESLVDEKELNGRVANVRQNKEDWLNAVAELGNN